MAVHHTVLALILQVVEAIVRRDTRERYTELVTRLVRPRLIRELFQSVIRSPFTIGPRKLAAGVSSTSGRSMRTRWRFGHAAGEGLAV